MEQNQAEFDWIVSKVGTVQSILEIGSREGASLLKWAMHLPKGAVIRSIDWAQPHPEWHNAAETKDQLVSTVAKLKDFGFDAEVLIADSHSKEARQWATAYGPYDVVFIDADHSEAGVTKDWLWYGKLGRTVVFHDINQPSVAAAWAEIKEENDLPHEEFTASGGMGVAIVRWPEAKSVAA